MLREVRNGPHRSAAATVAGARIFSDDQGAGRIGTEPEDEAEAGRNWRTSRDTNRRVEVLVPRTNEGGCRGYGAVGSAGSRKQTAGDIRLGNRAKGAKGAVDDTIQVSRVEARSKWDVHVAARVVAEDGRRSATRRVREVDLLVQSVSGHTGDEHEVRCRHGGHAAGRAASQRALGDVEELTGAVA